MLRYKNYSLVKPDNSQTERISQIIEDNGGSVFQEVRLNEIVEREFNSELFYLVDNPKAITNFSPVHIERKKFNLKRYHLKPLYDIPYAGFLDDSSINF